MAKGKGKSRRRIKDWRPQDVDGQDPAEAAPRQQKLSRRVVKLPPDRLAEAAANLDELSTRGGMVIGFYPGGVLVRTEGRDMLCSIAKTYRAPEGTSPLAVGDEVTVAMVFEGRAEAAAEDRDRADGAVIARQPRRTALARPQPRSGKRRSKHKPQIAEKVIVANMDALLIVAAVKHPPVRRRLIDRYLIAAERGELTPVVVINKIDLGRPDEHVLADVGELGVRTILTSAVTGDGLDEFASVLRGCRSVLAGASGVGKSTLINAVIPGAEASTQEVRRKNRRGRHTTAAAAVHQVPGGGMVVDTPGIRELGMPIEAAELPWYFPEFEQFCPECRFNNCTHTHEPDCAVLEAVEADKILRRRYESYLRLLATLDR